MPNQTPDKKKAVLDALAAGWRHVSNFQHGAGVGLSVIFVAALFTPLNWIGSVTVMGGAAVWGIASSVIKKLTRRGKKPTVEAQELQEKLKDLVSNVENSLDLLDRALQKVELALKSDIYKEQELVLDLNFLLTQVEKSQKKFTQQEIVDLAKIVTPFRTIDKVDAIFSTVNSAAGGIMLPVFWLLTANAVDPTDLSTSLAHKVGSLAIATVSTAWSVVATLRQYTVDKESHTKRLEEIENKLERLHSLMSRITSFKFREDDILAKIRQQEAASPTATTQTPQPWPIPVDFFSRISGIEENMMETSNSFANLGQLQAATLFQPASEMTYFVESTEEHVYGWERRGYASV